MDVLDTLKIIITAETEKLDKATASVKKQFADLNKTADKIAIGVTAAATAAGAAILGLANQAAKATDRVDKMSQKIGVSRKGFQEWDYIMSQNGASVESLQVGMKTLTNKFIDLQNGGAGSTEAFKALGLTLNDLKGKSQEEIFELTIKGLQGMEDGTQRAALANELFGKSGLELAPILNAGADSVEQLRNRAHELGLVMGDEAIDSGVKFGDTMDDLKKSFGAIVTEIGVQLMPIIQSLMEWFLENMPKIKEIVQKGFEAVGTAIAWVSDNSEWIIPILAGLVGAFAALKIIGVITTLMGIFNAVMAMNPITLIILAIAGLIAIGVALVMNWDKIIAALGGLWNKFKEIFGKIGDFVNGIFKGIGDSIKNSVNSIIDALNGLIKGANKLKFDIPDWVPFIGGKKFGLNIPTIPRLADGGMVGAGQMFIAGEAGKELIGDYNGQTTVMPLENTSFVAAMEQAMVRGLTSAMAQSGGSNIVLNVDGLTLAKATEKNLNKLSTLQGGLNIAF